MDQSANGKQPEEDINKTFVNLMSVSHVKIYIYILTSVGNASDADDIMQNTTVFMWERFSEFKPGSDFVRWGISIAFYKIKEFRNQQSRHQLSNEVLEKLHDSACENVNDAGSYIEILHHCIAKLPDSDKKLLELRYQADRSVKEISAMINRTVQAVYIRLAKLHGVLNRCINLTISKESA